MNRIIFYDKLSYFQVLEDTLLGFRIPPWRKAKNRRLFETEKFYLFDVEVTNYLLRRTPRIGTPEFGKSFEHYILMELKVYQAYRNPELDIRYWRTSSGYEVDFTPTLHKYLVQKRFARSISGHQETIEHFQDLTVCSIRFRP